MREKARKPKYLRKCKIKYALAQLMYSMWVRMWYRRQYAEVFQPHERGIYALTPLPTSPSTATATNPPITATTADCRAHHPS